MLWRHTPIPVPAYGSPFVLSDTAISSSQYHQQTDPPCSNMFGNSRAGPSGHRLEHVLGDPPRTCSSDHPKLLCQQCFEQLQVHQSMLWATVQNCFKYTKIQARACSGLQSKLFPKLLQVHKNMFWATILNCFQQVLGDHTKLLQAVSGRPYKTASSSFKTASSRGGQSLLEACLNMFKHTIIWKNNFPPKVQISFYRWNSEKGTPEDMSVWITEHRWSVATVLDISLPNALFLLKGGIKPRTLWLWSFKLPAWLPVHSSKC